jgi:hypothetical protein
VRIGVTAGEEVQRGIAGEITGEGRVPTWPEQLKVGVEACGDDAAPLDQ